MVERVESSRENRSAVGVFEFQPSLEIVRLEIAFAESIRHESMRVEIGRRR